MPIFETTCQLTREMSFFEARPAISKGEKKQSLDPAEGFENSLVLGYVTCLILRSPILRYNFLVQTD